MRTPEIGIPISAVLSHSGSGPTIGHPIDPLGVTSATHSRALHSWEFKKKKHKTALGTLSGPDLQVPFCAYADDRGEVKRV